MKTLVYSASIKGNSHYKKNIECQDSNSFTEEDFNSEEFYALAVGDGHGGSPYYRSKIGSSFACKIAKAKMIEFLKDNKELFDKLDETPCYDSISETIDEKIEELKLDIIDSWKKEVFKHFSKNEIFVANGMIRKFNFKNHKDGYFQRIDSYISDVSKNAPIRVYGENLSDRILDMIKDNLYIVYGSTLLCVGVYKDNYICIQIGDGKIYLQDKEGEVIRPIPDDEREFKNVTHSICQTRAIEYFKHNFIKGPIKLALLVTDGVENGLEFVDINEFAEQIYSSISDDKENFRKNMKPFLRTFSNMLSDDCTMGIIANDIDDEIFDKIRNSEEGVETEPDILGNKNLLDNFKNNDKVFSSKNNNIILEELLEMVRIKKENLSKQGLSKRQEKDELYKYIDDVFKNVKYSTFYIEGTRIKAHGNYDDESPVLLHKFRRIYGIINNIKDNVITYEPISSKLYSFIDTEEEKFILKLVKKES